MSLTARDRAALVAGALALVALVGAGWLLLAPREEAGAGVGAFATVDPFASFAASAAPAASASSELVVDVQGAVAQPGVVVLPAGSRVADAIAAAGGYAPGADLLAAASALNLAARVSDGEKVFVPIAGVAGGGDGNGSGSGDGPGSGGLVNLNTATPEALDALPGIGPVTVQKIVAARTERPFATLEELVERDVMNQGQLDKIRELVTL